MKIMSNFDTKLDENELTDAIQKYGEGNAILTKKHRFFLITPLFWLLAAIAAFWVLVWFSWYEYFQSHPKIFRTVCSAQFAVTLFWIIHSVQTIFHTIRVNKGRVYLDRIQSKDFKAGKFEHYLIHSFISLWLQTLLMFSDVIIALILKIDTFGQWIIILGGVGLNFIFILGIWLTISKIIDFEMYFNIFTPEQFTIYRQKGILKTESVSIATSTIKMVKESKTGFRSSLLGYGKVSIHPEGWANDLAPVNISYVTRPKVLVKKLNEFIDESKRMISSPVIPKL